MLLGNARNHLLSDTSSHLRRLQSSATLLENVKYRIMQCRIFGKSTLVTATAAAWKNRIPKQANVCKHIS
jgi:hypothetical protein